MTILAKYPRDSTYDKFEKHLSEDVYGKAELLVQCAYCEKKNIFRSNIKEHLKRCKIYKFRK